ncbi:MAG: hypothetical protein DDG60_03340 [Anaerolineae bacterium]|nr:MAG: hypothetical protein DDG60_03340 [Anaerolineae bacterium]
MLIQDAKILTLFSLHLCDFALKPVQILQGGKLVYFYNLCMKMANKMSGRQKQKTCPGRAVGWASGQALG